MILVWLLTAILQSVHVADAVALWGWFGHHVFLTFLLFIFFA